MSRKLYINELEDTFDVNCKFITYGDGYYATVVVNRAGNIFNIFCSYYNNNLFTNNTVTFSWDRETNTMTSLNFMRGESNNSEIEDEIINFLFSIPPEKLGSGLKTKSAR